jgi:hypothetical protein
MKLFIAPVTMIILLWSFGACKSSSPVTFCDTACLKDTVKFVGNHPLKPYVYISASQCHPDTITWSYGALETNRKLSISYLLESDVTLNKDYIKCYFNDTAYAWLLFNDCATGRGYQVKVAFSKTGKMSTRSSAVNGIDPKFSVADNLLAYTDRGNIYVEDVYSGKKAMMTFGQDIGTDYDNIHASIDSVNITDSKIWAKVKVGDAWKELQKNITLE